MANLSVPSDLPSTLSVPTVPKLPTPSQQSKTWAKPYPHHYHFHPQYIQIGPQRKTIDKIIREQQRKIAEEQRKKWEEESAPLCKLHTPNLINTKQILPALIL